MYDMCVKEVTIMKRIKVSWILLFCSLVLCICLANYTYNLSHDLKTEIRNLKKQNSKLKEGFTVSTNNFRENNSKVELCTENLYLWEMYCNGCDGDLNISATGPLAFLNTTGINTAVNESVKIISQDSFFTKLQITGYVPTWYVNNPHDTFINESNITGYILENSNLYISPNSSDKIAYKATKGTAVKAVYEYKDWVYVSTYIHWDSCELDSGWIKKDKIGSYDKFKSYDGVDVYTNTKEGKSWGKLMLMDNGNYTLRFPGGDGKDIDFSKVIFIGYEDK